MSTNRRFGNSRSPGALEVQSVLRKGNLSRWQAALLVTLGVLFSVPPQSQAAARQDDAALCEIAAQAAANDTGVPATILLALSVTETGRKNGGGLRPWPWATNTDGRGIWHPTREAALAHATTAIATTTSKVDLGCFQINHHWHGAAFKDPDEMLDPEKNALYAARFLADLHLEFGDWHSAAGAFHSRNEIHAAPYRARFERALALLDHAETPQKTNPGKSEEHDRFRSKRTDETARPRSNGFPLLIAGNSVPDQSGVGASLFPGASRAGVSLLTRTRASLFGGG